MPKPVKKKITIKFEIPGEFKKYADIISGDIGDMLAENACDFMDENLYEDSWYHAQLRERRKNAKA